MSDRTQNRASNEHGKTFALALFIILICTTVATLVLNAGFVTTASGATQATMGSSSGRIVASASRSFMRTGMATLRESSHKARSLMGRLRAARLDVESDDGADAYYDNYDDELVPEYDSEDYVDTSDDALTQEPTLRTIENSLQCVDGHIYVVRVTYDDAAGIPDGAQIKLVELNEALTKEEAEDPVNRFRPYDTERFVGTAELAKRGEVLDQYLNMQEGDWRYATKYLDVTLVDAEGNAISPVSPVEVTFETTFLPIQQSGTLELAWQLPVTNPTPEDPYGYELMTLTEMTDEVSTKATFTTDHFGELAVAGVARVLGSWDIEDSRVQLLGPKTLSSVDLQGIDVDTGKEGWELREAYYVNVDPSPWYGTTMWLSSTPLVETDDLGYLRGFRVRDGVLAGKIFAKGGTGVPVSFRCDEEGYALVWDTEYRRQSLSEGRVHVDGMMPQGTQLNATGMVKVYSDPSEVSAELSEQAAEQGLDLSTAAAYDISLTAGGEDYQPGEDKPVSVSITSVNINEGGSYQVWHVLDDGTVEVVEGATVEGNTIHFEATGFSVYMVVQSITPQEETEPEKPTVTITAGSGSKTYDGTALTTSSYTYEGLNDGDSIEDVTITGSQTIVGTSNNVASAAKIVDADGQDVTSSYSINYVDGSLEVTKASATVKADNQTKTYGQADPQLTATVTGLVGEDTITYTLTRAEGEDVGTYAITASGESDQGNYIVTYEPANLTIQLATVTVTADAKTKVYGDDDPDLTATVTGAGDGATVNYTLSRAAGQNVGEYAITVTAGENPNYTVNVVPGTFKINPRALTITADSDTKVYDGTALTKNSYTNTELISGHTLESVDITGSITLAGTSNNIPSAAKVVDDQGIDVTANYDITYSNGRLTVDPKPIAITAEDASKVYDGTALTEPGYTYEELAEGDVLESVEVTGSRTNVGTENNVPSAAKIINAAGKDVTESYDIDYVNGKLTIEPALITVTPDQNEKTYGDADPRLTATVSDLVKPEDLATITYTVNRESGENVGDYRLSVSGDQYQGNYEVEYDNTPVYFTINKAMATVKADSKSKNYGEADPRLTATVEGLKNGDEASVISYTIERDAGEDVGTYDIVPDGDAEQGNYDVTYETGVFTIGKVAATVTMKNATKTYGDEDPEFEYEVTGLKNDDDESVISFAISRDAGENVGEYTVTANGEEDQGNYTVSFVNAALTIERATATVSAERLTKVYGENDPELTVSVTGLQNGDDESVISYTIGREEGENTGTYTITPSGAAVQGNYNVTFKTSTLTITQAEVTVTANAAEKIYGAEDPELTAEIEGLLNGESEDLITYSLERDEGENVRTYAITASGDQSQGNYTVTYKAGTFTITRRPISVTITGHNNTAIYDAQSHIAEGYDIAITDDNEEDMISSSYAYKAEYVKFDEQSQAKTNPRIDVGEEYMGLTVTKFTNTNSNYQVVFEVVDGYQIVTPRSVSITVNGNHDSVNYDGQEHTVSDYVLVTEEALYDTNNVSYNGDVSAARTESGTTWMGLDENKFENSDTNFTATFTVNDGFITVLPIQINVRITGKTDSKSYDGTEHKVTGYTATSDSNLFDTEKLVFSGTAEASRTEITRDGEGTLVDTTYMGLSNADFSYDDINISANITIEDGWQKITPIDAEVSIVGNSDTSDYDGTEHTVNGYVATADPTLYNVDTDIAFTGNASAKQTNAGTKYMSLHAEQFSNTNPNFEDVSFTISADGYQTIRPITATVTIVGNNNEESPYPYDGTEHTVTGFTATADTSLYCVEDDEATGKTRDFTFSGTAAATRTVAGRTNMGLGEDQFENTNTNFSTVHFEIEDGYIDITPISATVTITGHNGTFTYDGTGHTVDGYETEFSTTLYDSSCFELITAGSDSVSRTEAGTSEMNLGSDSFRNINPNFEDVIFEVTDGSITINPAIVVSKYLNNVSATEAEEFVFHVELKDDEDNAIAGHVLKKAPEGGEGQPLTTDADGKASFSISVAGMKTKSVTLDIPYGSSLKIEEDKTDDPNNYATTINGNPGAETTLEHVTDSTVTLAFENAIGNVCRIGEDEFQTVSGALQWAQENNEHEVVIEMMVDYTMPSTDVVTIPADYTVTLSTASDYEGEGAATITRASGFTGPMFNNHGTLNIADEYSGTKIKIDGNKGNVTAESAIIENSGTVNIYADGTIQNAKSSVDGGAIHSTGTVNVSGGSLSGNSAANGGAIYATGTVTVSGGSLSGNSATNGGAVYAENHVTVSAGTLNKNTATTNGGAIYTTEGSVTLSGGNIASNAAGNNGGAVYTESGAVSVSGSTLSGNHADDGNGGAIYSVSGGVTVTDGIIGGENSEDANGAINGSAIFVSAGNASFSGGRITGNVASDGGAVGIGGESSRLFFSGSAYVQGNKNEANEASNVYLNVDTDLIINATGLNADAEIGIYVPGDSDLYNHRGVSGARFGGYTNATGIGCFKNDRTPGMTVSEDNYKMQWGKAVKVELRELNPFSGTNLPPTAQGTLKKQGDYFPTSNENDVSDIAGELLSSLGGITSGYTFACAFGKGATQYSECLTKVNWNAETGDWGFVNRAGEFVTYEGNPPTLVLYYSAPAYITLANNTQYPLNLTAMNVNGINVSSTHYGFVVARKGMTVEHFAPIENDDLTLAAGESIKYMFPGARKQIININGVFQGKTDSAVVDYTYTEVQGNDYTTGITKPDQISAEDAVNGFALPRLHLYNNNNTVEVALGQSTKICKIVELNGDGTVKEEHLYPSIQAAVEDGVEHYNAYKISVTEEDEEGNTSSYDTVKVEMIQDYLMPSTDEPEVPSGKNFTFTTADSKTTKGDTVYDGAGTATGSDGRAVISQDQGKTNSFFKVSAGGAGTGITVENLNFEGKQLDATSTNGGVISAKNSSVTVRNVSFANFSAGNGGAVYAQFGGVVKTISGQKIDACSSEYNEGNNWVYISNATFSSCTSSAKVDRFGGGGIWTNAKELTLDGCTFSKCHATQQGGAVYHRIDDDYVFASGSKTIVQNCKFEHCSANAAGGLEINAYDVEISDCTFDDCQALTRNGGGFNAYLRAPSTPNTSLRISGSTFNNCFAQQNGGVFRTQMNTYVTNCTFTNNTAIGYGGGIAQDNGNELSLSGCTVTGNKSGKQGGGIYTSGNLTLENKCVITGNSLTTNVVGDGAGVYLANGKTLTLGKENPEEGFLDTCTISGNETADGSDSNLRLPASNNVNTDSVIVRCNFTTGEDGDKLIHVLNANATGTQFGHTINGVTEPEGFKELEHIFVADNNELYGVYNRTNGTGIRWHGKVIAKVTDGGGRLLYFDKAHADPAIFDALDTGSNNPDKMTAFGLLKYGKNDVKLYYDDGSEYNEANRTYCVKMLEDYTASKYIMTNLGNLDWQTIVLTTAGKDDALYPYRGEEGTYAKITRGAGLGNYNLFNIMVNMTIRDITIDGGSENGITPNTNTRIVKMDPGSNTNAMLILDDGATLQNSKVNGHGGGILLNWGSSLTINDGAVISNCVATSNGGAVYKDGGNGRFIMQGGTIDHCSAVNGGGVYIVKHNANIKQEMSGGTITDCTATNGGGIFINGASSFYMSGGSITGNDVTGAGGGISINNNGAKLYFSGDVVVYDNTKGGTTSCNVELNQNSSRVINTTGLGDDATIGVYVSDSYFSNYGEEGDTFGRWATSESNLFLFINDRNDLRGAKRPNTTDEVWWQEMHSLVVTKTVSSDLPEDKQVEFGFTVTLHDAVTDDVLDITEAFGTGKSKMEFKEGVASFTLKNGESKTALYVPGTIADQVSNCRYEVKETGNAGFTTEVDHTETTTKTGTLDERTGDIKVLVHRADFTNTRKTGSLSVNKKVVSDQDEDKSLDFNFRVTLSSNAIQGTYGDMTFSNGVATFTLKDGETKTAEDLPTGITYTVTETANSDFNTATKVNDEERGVEGIDLQAGDNNHVVFTNTRKVGGLRLVKRVSSDATADKNRDFSIVVELKQDNQPVSATYAAKGTNGQEIAGGVEFDSEGKHTFTLKGDESVTIEGLPQGVVYNVTEAEDGFTTKYAYTDAAGRTDNTRTIGSDIVTCTVTNTRLTGRLQIKKTLVSDRSADATSAQFTFIVRLGNTVTDSATGETSFVPDGTINKTYSSVKFNGGVSEPITITGANSKTITGLPRGIEYKVEEQKKDKFTLTAVDDDTNKTVSTGSISGTTSIAKFTNTRDVGNLKIEKTVSSDAAADFDKSFSFTIKLGDTKISKSYELRDEDGEPIPGGINFSGGTATNLTMKHGESRTIVGLPTDVTYTVSETEVSGFTTEPAASSGTIDTTLSTASFTNTRNVGSLTVKKTVAGDLLDGDTIKDRNKRFSFEVKVGSLDSGNFVVDQTIGDTPNGKPYGGMTFKNGVATFKLKHDEEITATGLPGDLYYMVTETGDSDFNTSYTGAAGFIKPAQEAVAAFTNKRKSGKLIITKTVSSDVASDKSQQYSFDIKLGKTVEREGVTEFIVDTALNKRYGSVTFTDGEATVQLKPSTGTASTTLSGLPVGIEYEVTETPVEHMTTKVGEEATNVAKGTIGTTDSTAAFNNIRDTGSLKVTKTLVSDLAADQNVGFEFTVKLGSVSGTYSGVTFQDGTGTFTLKSGESKTLEGLPAGLEYVVTETANSNFDVTEPTGDQGTIVKDETEEAAFTNTRKTGDLRLTKRVVSDQAADEEKEFTFTVRLADITIGKTTETDKTGKTFGDLTFKDGVATVKLKKNQSVNVTGLPTTLSYTVEEEEEAGFTVAKEGDTGTIDTERRDVTFTNTRSTGNLTVQKVLASDLATDANEEFAFKVTLSDTSIGAVTADTPNGKTFGDGGMTFKDGVAEFTLKGGQSLTASDLPAGVTYTVEETTNANFATEASNEAGSIPTNTTATATFTNTRKTGKLVISKTVDSDLAADKTTGFKFNVTLTGLSDAAKNKTYSGITFRNGGATITLKHSESKALEGLPVGASYTVREVLNATQTADFDTTPSGLAHTGVISTEDTTAAFTNTRKKGNLSITKTVVSDLAVDKTIGFEFTVTLSDTSIGATTADDQAGKDYDSVLERGEGDHKETISDKVNFKNGIAEVSVRHGEKLTIEGLPTDVKVTVKENLTNDQKADFTTVPSSLTRTATISTEDKTVAFTNTRKIGKLTVRKTLASALTADKSTPFEFEVRLGSMVKGEGDVETFTVDETLSKTFSGVEFIEGVATIELKGGESKTIEGLPTDLVCEVEETLIGEQKEYFITDPAPSKVQRVISNTATAIATIKNTRKTGDLKIEKEVINGLTTDATRKFSLTVTLGGMVKGEGDEEPHFVVDEGISGTYGDVTFRKGVGTFTLMGGTSKTIRNVPIGMTYVVHENRYTGFIPVLDVMGTVVQNSTATDEATGDITALPGRTEKVINTRAVCKITDSEGKLLYYKDENDVVWPAAYGSLGNAFETLTAPAFFTDADGDTSYNGNVFNVEMLVSEYTLAAGVEVPEDRTVTLTTADKGDTDGFPGPGVTSVITRSGNYGSMLTSSGILTLTKVTLDGGSSSGAANTSSANGGIVNVVAGSLTVANGATLQHSATAGDGGAVYVADSTTMAVTTGGTIIDNTAVNGGAIYVAGGGTLTMTGGTVNRNESTGDGAGVYLAEGSKMNLSGNTSFGGSGLDADGNITTTNGNWKNQTLTESFNGGKPYSKPRQDIFIAGFEGEDSVADSLVIAGDLTNDDAGTNDGSIWVWAEQAAHYKKEMQFAVVQDGVTLANEGATTLKVFRNALDDDASENPNATSGEYLYGVTGDVAGRVYWNGPNGSRVVILRKVLAGSGSTYSSLAGATFDIYPNMTSTNPVKDKNGKVLENLVSGDNGVFYAGELGYGVYYLAEKSLEGSSRYNPNDRTTWLFYRMTVNEDGYTFKNLQGEDITLGETEGTAYGTYIE